MNNKRLIIGIILASLCLSGCQRRVPINTKEENDTNISNENNVDIPNENIKIDKVENNMEKSISLVDDIYELNNRSNTMISPISLNMALGLLLEGATGDSKDSLIDYLGENYSAFAENYIKNEIEQFNYTKEAYDEWDSGYSTALEIANSIWINNNLSISNSYKESVESKYDAQIDSFDTNDIAKSVNKINDWCDTKTHGMIPNIITEDNINDNSSAILINSIYLESGWAKPWDLPEENTDIFKTFNNDEIKCNLMSSVFKTYYENENATAFGAPYVNGMTFIGILPKEEGEFTLKDLDIPKLLKNKDNSYDNVYAKMPKLKFETSASLSESLKDKGLSPIFKGVDNSDFVI